MIAHPLYGNHPYPEDEVKQPGEGGGGRGRPKGQVVDVKD